MKIWKIWHTVTTGYDVYDSAVVLAETEGDARKTHPDGDDECSPEDWEAWATSPDDVSAMLIGEATPGSQAGVVCASFNAG